jgi:hypothetical protein
MQTRRAFFLTLIAAASAAGWGRAQGLSEADQTELAALFEEWERAAIAGDVQGFLRIIPPAVLSRIAELAGVTPDEFREKADKIVGPLMMTDFASLGVRVSVDWERVSFAESETGRPYVVIRRTLEAGPVTAETPVLAVWDNQVWYMLQVDNPMMRALLLQSYPDLSSVDFSTFPESTMSIRE